MKKRGPICEYHSTSTDGNQLSIAHLVVKCNTTTSRIVYVRCYHAIYHHHTRTLHIMYKTSHAKIIKTSHVNPSIGAICTGACLAPKSGYTPQYLGLVDLLTPPARASPPSKRLPQRRALHVMICICLLIKLT
jgi:hypothetical protein